MVAPSRHDPVAAAASEQQALAELAALLCMSGEHGAASITAGGETVELPATVMVVLRQVAHALASGQMVSLVPIDKELTTQQAADMLNVSRPHVVKLLEEGAMPFTKTGAHRRVRLDDLLAYKQRRDAERHAALIEITRLGEELDELEADEA